MELEQRMRRKVVRSLYSALLHLTHDFDKNIHPSKQPWLEIDSLLSAFGAVPTEFGMMRSMRDVFASKKSEANPEEIERLLNEGFAALKQLSTCYADMHPWASLFQNRLDRELIDRQVLAEEAAVTVARLAGRPVDPAGVNETLDTLARLAEQHDRDLRMRVTEGNEWKLNPWEEQTMSKESSEEAPKDGGEGEGGRPKEEAWRLDPFQVTLPSVCIFGEARGARGALRDKERAEDRRRWGAEEVLDAINRTLYDDAGFYGAPGEQWKEPETNYIDSVLALKGGIPLSLSVIYMAVARRMGLQLYGVNVPSHFLLYSPDANCYIDAYNNGKRMSPLEATEFASVILRHNNSSVTLVHKSPQLRFSTQDLEGQKTGTFGICMRMVRNLYAASVNEYGSGSEEAQRWLRQLAILQNW
jgi:regulator of sirC expression with transglutaminase-like and TPR domain